jgi:hypothetical protein
MTLRVCLLFVASCVVGACGPSQSGNTHVGPGGSGGSGGSAGSGGSGGVGGSAGMSGGGPMSITITPNPATLLVEVQNGVGAPQSVAFVAKDETGAAVTAAWQIDRGELGTLDGKSGMFVASGQNAGSATVTATVGAQQATAQLVVAVHAVTIGATPRSGTGPQVGPEPAGGFNGVGGVPLGGPPPSPVVNILNTQSGKDNAFALLYPYDGTVFPRGMLPPLLQWSVPSIFHATAVMVHLKENGYEFTGYYAGTELVNAPVDAAAWAAATVANSGDPLLVELKISDGTQVLGPLSQKWTIAKSPLHGTVYYNTYDSKLNKGQATNGSDGIGSILRIDPGSSVPPTLAVPALDGTCHACHEVSADGSTLFTATTIDDSTKAGVVYDLRQTPAALVINYSLKQTPSSGGMFTYGGIYPDGTMALASSQEDYHAWGGSSDVYSVATQAAVGTSGFSNLITRAVTPSYSPDGRHVAFGFWAGPGNGTIKPGNGSLTVMDFTCGAPMSSVACAAGGGFAFSNLRQLYSDPAADHYVGWPSFTPDGKMVAFQHTYVKSDDAGVNTGSALNTRGNARAEVWLADVPDSTGATRFVPQRLCALNGYAQSDCATGILPTNANNHANDEQLNYEPNVTPIASGGYYWVVFTSRRLYGNVAVTEPYTPYQFGPKPTAPPTKKLWMAAIDPNPKPGQDPSHPAFYLPNQELWSGNMRAYWVNQPCLAAGKGCQTGDECCSGYCTDKLMCGDKPVGCVPEFGKCTTTADCCGTGTLSCIDNLCTVRPIQ